MLRGSSASITREIVPVSRSPAVWSKSWAELETFFTRERQSEGRTYKKEPAKQLQEYRSWVYAAIDCIVDRASSVGFNFYYRDTMEKLTTSSKAYKAITKPILYPNDFMTFRFIKAWCQTQLDLCGKAAIWKVRNRLGMPWELWPLDMNFFQGIDWDTKDYLIPPKGFKFKIGEQIRTFPLQDVIWLRYPHPESIWDGFSPIQSQAYVTDIDHYLEVYERSFFKNSARIDFVLEHEGNIDEDTAQRIKDKWMATFGGAKRSYQPMVLANLKVVPIGYTQKDFQFIETAGWTKERVLSAYRVPEGKLGLFADINRANQKGIDTAFNQGCVLPRLGLWDEEFSKQLLWEINPRVIMLHDNPVPRDREMDLEELKMRKDIYTVNENRNWWDGAKPTDGGDVVLVENRMIPLTMVGELPEAGGGQTPEGDDDKPGDDEETPDYDTEHDPGGDDSDKKSALPYHNWDETLNPLITAYSRTLDYTHGWSYDKAKTKAKEIASFIVDDDLRDTFVESIGNAEFVDDFKKKVVKFVVKQVAGRVYERALEYKETSDGLQSVAEG